MSKVFVFVRGGIVETVTDESAKSFPDCAVIDYDNEGECPVCHFDMGEADVCPDCGYNSSLDTRDEAIRAYLDMEEQRAENLESVDLIASGYEWECPTCETTNSVIEVRKVLRCSKCETRFVPSPPDHAFE